MYDPSRRLTKLSLPVPELPGALDEETWDSGERDRRFRNLAAVTRVRATLAA